MYFPWDPVIYLDIGGSFLILLLSFSCFFLAWIWITKKREDIFRQYIFLLTLAIVIFAVSRSFGHLVKQLLILNNYPQIWGQIAPFSGAVNSAAFIVIFALGIYFYRFQKIHLEIENYKNNLESLVEARTTELKHTNLNLEKEIKERERIETDLLSEKERLAVTLRSIGDGVITTDVQGNIVLLNKVAEELTGWKQRDAFGLPLTDVFYIINEKTGKLCDNPVEKVLATGQIVSLANHTILIARDGKKRSIADSGAPIRDQKSDIIGVVLVFRDVTNQKRMEEEFLKFQKLESVGVLAGGIAHDFNNILAAILGNINLALDICETDDRLRDLLSEVEEASLRAKGLTQQLLTFSKGGEPIKGIASIGEIIKDSAEFILHGSKVRCDYFIDDEIQLVEIDSEQISQVIQNVILNAKEAMPKGGIIEVTCKNFKKDDDCPFPLEQGDYVEVAIKDNGIGIPEGRLDKIFDPYFTTKQTGSGLGLAITHSIMSKHGGYITAESDKAEGTVFYIYLPAARGKKIKSTKKIREESNMGRGKILVMDDEELVRNVSYKLLVHLGYDVILSKDGEEALAKYKKAMESGESIDLVIMDLTIPGGMGGKEAVQELHRIDPNARVVVSSGYSNDPVLAHYDDYGFSAAIIKPFQLKELDELVAELVN